MTEAELGNQKQTASMTGIFPGAFDVHKFVFGYDKTAAIMLVAALAGGVIAGGSPALRSASSV